MSGTLFPAFNSLKMEWVAGLGCTGQSEARRARASVLGTGADGWMRRVARTRRREAAGART